jgi:hypothetical protein
MKSRLLAGFFILSIILNIYFFTVQPAREDLVTLKDKINLIEKNNSELSKHVYLDNLSNQNYASQLDLYRHRISELESKLGSTASGQQVVQEGTMMNFSVNLYESFIKSTHALACVCAK